jgi:hypothetical protein
MHSPEQRLPVAFSCGWPDFRPFILPVRNQHFHNLACVNQSSDFSNIFSATSSSIPLSRQHRSPFLSWIFRNRLASAFLSIKSFYWGTASSTPLNINV